MGCYAERRKELERECIWALWPGVPGCGRQDGHDWDDQKVIRERNLVFKAGKEAGNQDAQRFLDNTVCTCWFNQEQPEKKCGRLGCWMTVRCRSPVREHGAHQQDATTHEVF